MELFMSNATFPREVSSWITHTNELYEFKVPGKKSLTDLSINFSPSGPPPENLKELEDRFCQLFSESRQYDIEEFMKFLESGKKQTND